MRRGSLLAGWLLGATLAARAALAADPIAAVAAIGFTVADADRSAAFLVDVLGFERGPEVEVAGTEIERDGHFLELIEFPPGVGDPRWQRAGDGRLFLGIDHTAIVVADTEASLRFYRDLLGLRVAGESENWGPEQERLNGVFGARLRITTLRAASGPGSELLEYLSPRDGRLRPADARAVDLLHWQTDLVPAGPIEELAARLRAARTASVSAGTVELPGGIHERLGFRHGMLIADPDGHVLRIRTAAPRRAEG